MNWLSQNWIWVVLGVGFLFFLRRTGAGGCGMRHSEGSSDSRGHEKAQTTQESGGSEEADRREHRRHGC